MARLLLVEDDARVGARTAEALRGAGHDVVIAEGAPDALVRLASTPIDAVIADVVLEGLDGLALAAQIARLPRRVPVVLCSALPSVCQAASQRARAEGIALAGVLPKPVDPAALAGLLAPPVVGTAAHDDDDGWLGEDFLRGVDGEIGEFPPARVLYLAARLGASGALEVAGPGIRARIVLKGGKFVHAEGLAGLLRAVDPQLPEGPLGAGIGLAASRGHDPTRVMAAAARALAAHVVGWAYAPPPEAWVSWLADAPAPPGTFPLPVAPQLAMIEAHRDLRDLATLRAVWGGTNGRVVARFPSDTPAERWALDATALRLLREAGAGAALLTVFDKLAGNDGDRRLDAFRAADLLQMLGLVRFEPATVAPAPEPSIDTPPGEALRREGPPPPQESSTSDAARRAVEEALSGTRTHPPTSKASSAPAPAAPSATAAPAVTTASPAEDPQILRLRTALERMKDQYALDVLELGEKRVVGDDELTTAFHNISKRYHPDLYFSAAPEIRALAEACFEKVNAAHAHIRAPGGMDEVRRILTARQAKLPFVPEKDYQAARMTFKRGEVAWRERNWAAADASFVEAYRRDPHTWPHALYHAHAGALAKRLTAEAAVAELDKLLEPYAKHLAQIQTVAGHVLKHADKLDAALVRYKAAVGEDPAAHEAVREIRLADRRASEGGPGLLGGLFGKKK